MKRITTFSTKPIFVDMVLRTKEKVQAVWQQYEDNRKSYIPDEGQKKGTRLQLIKLCKTLHSSPVVDWYSVAHSAAKLRAKAYNTHLDAWNDRCSVGQKITRHRMKIADAAEAGDMHAIPALASIVRDCRAEEKRLTALIEKSRLAEHTFCHIQRCATDAPSSPVASAVYGAMLVAGTIKTTLENLDAIRDGSYVHAHDPFDWVTMKPLELNT